MLCRANLSPAAAHDPQPPPCARRGSLCRCCRVSASSASSRASRGPSTPRGSGHKVARAGCKTGAAGRGLGGAPTAPFRPRGSL